MPLLHRVRCKNTNPQAVTMFSYPGAGYWNSPSELEALGGGKGVGHSCLF